MRPRLLELLCCPRCQGLLSSDPFDSDGSGRVAAGILRCGCGEWFPVIDHVPRMLLGELRAPLRVLHAGFYEAYADLLPAETAAVPDAAVAAKLDTSASFGFEWSSFSDYAADNFAEFIEPLPDGFFGAKLGLDVGCGAGRHARQSSALGAEIVGMDLSHAVDSAFRLNRDDPQAHFVQADVYDLPFRGETFEFIYSLGVLHHLPDPEAGFRSLLAKLRPGAPIFIWVYQKTTRKKALELARSVTKRLPLTPLKWLCWLAAVVDYGIFVNLYRAGRRIGFVERHAPFRLKAYAQHDFHTSYTDWFDRLSAPISNFYSAEELAGWFRRAELADVDIAPVEDVWVWGIGRR